MKSEDKKLLWGLNIKMMQIYQKICILEQNLGNEEEIKNLNKQFDRVLKQTVAEQGRIEIESVL